MLPGLSASAGSTPKESRNLYCLISTALLSLLILIFSFSGNSSLRFFISRPVSSASNLLLFDPNDPSLPPPPSLAYLISGSNGDVSRVLRLLSAVYHPKNHYLLHLDLTATNEQRAQLALAVQGTPVYHASRNVDVIGKADVADPRGSSALAATLHGASILLRFAPNWDWFINLSAKDYPLVTQDDLLHILSFLPRDLNFVQHTSNFTLRESRRVRLIHVDPGFYLAARNDMFYATQKRELPDFYKLFIGSSSVILSRKFIEFCILGTDNLPRILLMYCANTPSSDMNYFHTVLCNSPEFNNTTVNYNMHFVSWDDSLKRDPHTLGLKDLEAMLESGAAFGTQFPENDPVLDHIDQELLNRSLGRVVPGGWCLHVEDGQCTQWGDADVLRPGSGAKRLAKSIVELFSNGTLRSNHCIFE
ncbi:beta-glucuronosyltransferase GlcAT14A-like [Aristolochia californica]|uniref:beta-glucuronosyltransferase GlcAT14A-like n=1 Tax=Aristolochia californica TaxID=171875 RepID=UPI0035D84C54